MILDEVATVGYEVDLALGGVAKMDLHFWMGWEVGW